MASVEADDSGDVKDWIAQVKQLQLQRKAEDEARNRKLEEDILAERRARQERRANRSRSVSPEKLGNSANRPASSGLPKVEASTAPKSAVPIEKAEPTRPSSQENNTYVAEEVPAISEKPTLTKTAKIGESTATKVDVRQMLEKRDPSYFRQTPKPVGLRKSSSSQTTTVPMALLGLSKMPEASTPLPSKSTIADASPVEEAKKATPPKPKSSESPIIPIKPTLTKLPDQLAPLASPSGGKRLSAQLSPLAPSRLQTPLSGSNPTTPIKSGSRSGSPTRAESPTRFASMQAGSSMSSADLLATMRSGLKSTAVHRQPAQDHVKATLLSAKGGLRSPTSPALKTFGTSETPSPGKLIDSPRLLTPRMAKTEESVTPIARQNSAPVSAPADAAPLTASFTRHHSMPPKNVKQSDLSNRFNPGLASLLQRGPPPSVQKGVAPEEQPVPGAMEEEKAAIAESSQTLTHMTKSRARRPGKRPPTSLAKVEAATSSKESPEPTKLTKPDEPVAKPAVPLASKPVSRVNTASSTASKPAALSAKPSLAERFNQNNADSLLVAPKPLGSPHRFDIKRTENRSPTLPELKTSPLMPDFKRMSLSSPKSPSHRNSMELGKSATGSIPGMWSQARKQEVLPMEKPSPPSKPVAYVQLEDVAPQNTMQNSLPAKPELPAKSEPVRSPSVFSGRSVSPFKREGRTQSIHHKSMTSSSSIPDVGDLLRSRANSMLMRDLSIKAAPILPSPQTSPRLPWAESARPPPTSSAPSVTRLNSRPGAGGGALLFCVRQHVRSIVIDELLCKAAQLCSGFVYILQQPEQVTIWQGRGAAPAEVEAAREFAHSLSDATPIVLREGDESPDFWKALGGQGRYASASYWKLKKDFKHYRTALYTVDHVDQRIHISMKEAFSVADLKGDKVHVIDTFFELYTIIPSVKANVKRDDILAALKFVRDHSTKSGHTRPFVPMALVVSCLSRWPRDLKAVFREPVEDTLPNLAILELETAEQVLRFSKFSRKELAEGTALGADYKRLEDFCDANCFDELFAMDAQQFKRASFEIQKQSRDRALRTLGVYALT
ncbi:hypothetical protein BCR37DRAFT_392871 [Protomyces lactucae-debilis]|uniref:DUF4045 domain-containing protein n=1 Tax=Protomyces lactucae-debilis TaxID=2754530 RepID=A0A1Y2FFH7_PROLT|nr:uncharacterized protein BCR37DRAFT_392871 [Protomyces lactucae-debilis]ORY82671.1 hypothetical protein BCR37DRAFT_392871 [Protomyces lactucae-debilis]